MHLLLIKQKLDSLVSILKDIDVMSLFPSKLNKPGRLSDSGLPVIECGSSVMDFAMDPFNNHQLATGKLSF